MYANGSVYVNDATPRSRLFGPLTLGLAFHPLEPLVVVRELLHVRERDLAGDNRVILSNVGLPVVSSVLELDVHAGPELFKVEARRVHADRIADRRGAPVLPSVLVTAASLDRV